jgi:hypothetical protein
VENKPEVPEQKTIKDIIDHVNKRYDEWKQKRAGYEAQWYLNLAYYCGQQWVQYRHSVRRLQEITIPSWKVNARVTANIITNFVKLIRSKMLRQEPILRIKPSNLDEKHIRASLIGDKFMQYCEQHLKLLKVKHRLVNSVIIFGDGFLKPYWDRSKGEMFYEWAMTTVDTGVPVMDKTEMGLIQKVDQNGENLFYALKEGHPYQEAYFTGDIDVSVLTPLEIFVPSDATSHDTLREIMEVRLVDIDEIHDTYNIDVKPEPIDAIGIMQEITSITGTDYKKSESHCALVKEYWQAPNKYYPNGRHIIVANDQLLLNSEIPKEFLLMEPPFPYFKFSFDDIPGRYWSRSPLDDSRHLQKHLNRTLSRIMENSNLGSAFKWLIPDGCGVETGVINQEPGQEIHFNSGPWGAPQAIRPEPVGQSLIELPQILQGIYNDVTGIHDISYGKAGKVRSGQALANMAEMDETSLEPVLDDFNANYSAFGRALLHIGRNHIKEARMLKIVGRESVEYVNDFYGEMLEGSEDPICETSSGLPQNRISRFQMVMQLVQAGLYDGPKALKALEIEGDDMFKRERQDESRAKMENDRMMKGELVSVEMFDDDIIHLKEHFRVAKEEQFQELAQKPSLHNGPEDKLTMKDDFMAHCKSHIEKFSKPENLTPDLRIKYASLFAQPKGKGRE